MNAIKINVRMGCSSELISIDNLSDDATVNELSSKVHELLSVSEFQRWQFAGKQLDAGQKLAYYNVQCGSTLNCVRFSDPLSNYVLAATLSK
jgi:Ubiquitin family